MDWKDLEIRFAALVVPRSTIWVDHQAGAAGDFWRCTGGGTGQSLPSFRELSSIAGRKLGSLPEGVIPHRILAVDNDQNRWFALLEANSVSIVPGLWGEMKDSKGNSSGIVTSQRIHDPVGDSVRVCLRLSEYELESDLVAGKSDVGLRRVFSVIGANPIVSAIIGTVIGGLVLALLL